ncbi:adenylate/guanylate cyclase domain-containing protein, partial [bacterium]|nr:adenylate/guanylate cyclase domain-containing protein [bacterium]
VFGDGVNVASRIERLAEGGGICISEQVYETIRNKSGIEAEFLGEKRLKNVDRLVKVFALKEGGLAFPPKAFRRPARFSWLKKRKYPAFVIGVLVVFAILFIIYLVKSKDSLNLDVNLIAVAIFENQTGDESLDPVGRMTSDWITQGIASTGLVSVVPSVALETINNIHQNMDGIRSLAEETHAQTIITGVFYKQINNLQFYAHIVDAQEGGILNAVGPVSGPVDDPLEAIELTRQKVMGSLAAHFDQEFTTHSDRTLKPPLYGAYEEFLIGIALFFKYNVSDAILHFYKAAELDTSYLLPLLWACHSYHNIGDHYKVDSLIHVFKKHRGKFTTGEQYFFDFIHARHQGDTEGTYKASRIGASYHPIF